MLSRTKKVINSVEFIYCECGCGLTRSRFGDKGKECRFINYHYFKLNKFSFAGKNHGGWKGGRHYDRAGYVLELAKDHPYVSTTGYVQEHRLVMEKHLGRFLTPEEHVHHINGVKDDNRIENLQLMSASEHTLLHLKKRGRSDMSNRKCLECGKNNTYVRRNGIHYGISSTN